MLKTLQEWCCYARRFKFTGALALVFLSGWLLSMGTSAWYYDRIMSAYIDDKGREVARLTADVDVERRINRQHLSDIAEQASINAKQSAANAKQLEYIARIAEQAAKDAKEAARDKSKALAASQGVITRSIAARKWHFRDETYP